MSTPAYSLAQETYAALGVDTEAALQKLQASRGIRWDSDHVGLLDNATRGIMEEFVRGDFLGRTHIGLDFFDASIRTCPWAPAWLTEVKSYERSVLSSR